MSSSAVILLVAILAGISCSLAGIFLVLRRMAMIADAISHSILPGLVGGYVLGRGPNLFLGFLGALAAGLGTVFLVEALARTKRLKDDAAIGLVFTTLFALGVFVVSRQFSHVHLDTDAVLFGEIALAPFDLLEVGGRGYGPLSLWVLGALTLLNVAFIGLFFKELKVATFDPVLAATLGFAPALLNILLMGVVAVTTVGAFGAVGAVLAVALIVIPSATASLLTRRLPVLIALAAGIGASGGLVGYFLAHLWDVSISGMIAASLGGLFGLAVLFGPRQGILAQVARRRRQRSEFAVQMLLMHLATHEGTPEEREERRVEHLVRELGWEREQAERIVARAVAQGTVRRDGDELFLTPRPSSEAEGRP
jgi:manganese/zinc/iron transport system permease protein